MIWNRKGAVLTAAPAILALAILAPAIRAQQPRPLLSTKDALELSQRIVDLVESTAVSVPNLARASAPVQENTRQALKALKESPQLNVGLTYAFLIEARSYIALSDSVPKPYPFAEAAQKQFQELRLAIDRMDAHFRALLDQKEAQLRTPDRDNIRRYSDANQKVPPPTPDKVRVVFLGDSITDGWRLDEYFGDRDFINRGISGQITGEMLGRMKEDVVNLKPKAMLVLAGTNDFARGIAIRTIEDNLSMMADIAVYNNIQPMFASVLPISDYHRDVNPTYAQSKRRPMNSIRELNDWIQSMCEHPNAKGYRVMAPIALAAIDKLTTVAPPPPPKKKKSRFGFLTRSTAPPEDKKP
jgi:lysophospholipase L1-like esterase